MALLVMLGQQQRGGCSPEPLWGHKIWARAQMKPEILGMQTRSSNTYFFQFRLQSKFSWSIPSKFIKNISNRFFLNSLKTGFGRKKIGQAYIQILYELSEDNRDHSNFLWSLWWRYSHSQASEFKHLSEVNNFHNNWQTQVCVPFTKIRTLSL